MAPAQTHEERRVEGGGSWGADFQVGGHTQYGAHGCRTQSQLPRLDRMMHGAHSRRQHATTTTMTMTSITTLNSGGRDGAGSGRRLRGPEAPAWRESEWARESFKAPMLYFAASNQCGPCPRMPTHALSWQPWMQITWRWALHSAPLRSSGVGTLWMEEDGIAFEVDHIRSAFVEPLRATEPASFASLCPSTM